MHERRVVVNTTPLIALAAAGAVEALPFLYEEVIVPRAVADEVRAGGLQSLGANELDVAAGLQIQSGAIAIPPYLVNSLDVGEAAVVATALASGIGLVCIDEVVGRRVARLSGLTVTGSLGVLLKAKSKGYLAGVAPG